MDNDDPVDFAVYKNIMDSEVADNISEQLIYAAELVSEKMDLDLRGFSVVAWNEDGTEISSFVQTSESDIPVHLIPEHVKIAIQQALLSQGPIMEERD